jgi:ribosomal-protein-alanine N-acetyltransferase
MSASEIARTPRLVVEYLRAEHIEPLCDIWCDPAVTKFMGGPRVREKVRGSLKEELELPETYTLWPVVEQASGNVIGHCGLLEKEQDGHKDIELVYVIGSGYQRRGYGFEASCAIAGYGFANFHLDRLIALIEPENQPSQRLAEKLGFAAGPMVVRPSGGHRIVYSLARPSAA